MDGRRREPPGAEGPDGLNIITDLRRRLGPAEATRLGSTVLALVEGLHRLAGELRLSPAELQAVIGFLTEVGHRSDARRQEWVLLADVLGLSSAIAAAGTTQAAGATPGTVAGPFYRADAPDLPAGADICRDGKGVPLAVKGRVLSLDGSPLGAALVEVWQANGAGKYENQEPDHQPENNLRGRFRTDGQGRFAFRSIMPKGYALPADGPVGRLMRALGLALDRPAHLHFRVSAEGHDRLTTHIFDRADPAIGRDALFGVRPELLADFRAPAPGSGERSLELTLVLCPTRQG